MLKQIKNFLPYSLGFSIAFALIGIPLEHYHAGHMASELALSFVAAFIACVAVHALFTWISEMLKRKKQ